MPIFLDRSFRARNGRVDRSGAAEIEHRTNMKTGELEGVYVEPLDEDHVSKKRPCSRDADPDRVLDAREIAAWYLLGTGFTGACAAAAMRVSRNTVYCLKDSLEAAVLANLDSEAIAGLRRGKNGRDVLLDQALNPKGRKRVRVAREAVVHYLLDDGHFTEADVAAALKVHRSTVFRLKKSFISSLRGQSRNRAA
jgi:hypothetical protein